MSYTKFQISNNFFHWFTAEWIFFQFWLLKRVLLLMVNVTVGQQFLWKEFPFKSLTNQSRVKFVKIFWTKKFSPGHEKIISYEISTSCKTYTQLKKCLIFFQKYFVTVWLDLDTLSLPMMEWNSLPTARTSIG